MKKPKRYVNQTYQQEYLFFMGWKLPELQEYCWHHRIPLVNLRGYGGMAKMIEDTVTGNLVIMIWIEDRLDNCTIHHETNHAAAYTLQNVGVIPSFENDEPFTYLSDELFRYAMKIK